MADQLRFPPTVRGYDLREVVSALQKAIRRSQTDEALYWATEMHRSGYGNWCFKRLRIIASEDVGPAAPGIASEVRALYENWQEAYAANKKNEKPGEEYLFLFHAVIALCHAPKSRITDWALHYHVSDNVQRFEIPDEALDKHTVRGKNKGRGQKHFLEEASMLAAPTVSIAVYEAGYLAEVEKANDGHPSFESNPFARRKPEADEGTQANMLEHETGAK